MTVLAWGTKLSPVGRQKVARIARELERPPSELMAVMAFETGETFSPSIRNAAGSSAVGMIQFMTGPGSWAVAHGYTRERLEAMTQEEQLDVVREYFEPYRGRLNSISDLYMAVLRPSAIGKPEDFPLITSDEGKTYAQNKGLDLNADGNITKAEATTHIIDKLAKGMRPDLATTEGGAQEEAVMAKSNVDLSGIIGMLATAVNPMAGMLFNKFTQDAKENIAQEVASRPDVPGVGQAVADALTKVILAQAKLQTGKTDEMEAVAVARQDPAVINKIATATQQEVAEKLDDVSAFLDRVAARERERLAASDDSRDKAAKRADTPEGWKLRWQQVTFTQQFLGYAAIGIAILIAALTASLAMIPDAAISAVLNLIGQLVIALVTTIGLLGATFRDQNGFSFGGTASDNAEAMAKDELIARRPPPASPTIAR